ncbi:hypothetical protein THOD03_130106 [Vibrio harveyi]|nr:hypothetical protein THOD03_130106 [Vibrio harveyi]
MAVLFHRKRKTDMHLSLQLLFSRTVEYATTSLLTKSKN